MTLGVFWPLKLFRSVKGYDPHPDDVKAYQWNQQKLMGVILPHDGKPFPVPPPVDPGCILLEQEAGISASLEDVVGTEAFW